jgi:hypothetical protein
MAELVTSAAAERLYRGMGGIAPEPPENRHNSDFNGLQGGLVFAEQLHLCFLWVDEHNEPS